MFGSKVGSLNIYMDEYNKIDGLLVQSNRTLAWKSTGTKAKKWFEGRKIINGNDKYFKIVFEGVLGKSYSEATIGTNIYCIL